MKQRRVTSHVAMKSELQVGIYLFLVMKEGDVAIDWS